MQSKENPIVFDRIIASDIDVRFKFYFISQNESADIGRYFNLEGYLWSDFNSWKELKDRIIQEVLKKNAK
jgi:hypothetical protein